MVEASNEMGRLSWIMKEAAAAYFMVLQQHSPRVTQENHEKLQPVT